MSNFYSLEEKRLIISLHLAGHNYVSISKMVHRSVSGVFSLLRQYALYGDSVLLPRPCRFYPTEFKLSVISDMQKKGLSLWEAGLKYGISHQTIWRWSKQFLLFDHSENHDMKEDEIKVPNIPLGLSLEEQNHILKERLEDALIENAVLKKLAVLVQERKKRESGKNSKPFKN